MLASDHGLMILHPLHAVHRHRRQGVRRALDLRRPQGAGPLARRAARRQSRVLHHVSVGTSSPSGVGGAQEARRTSPRRHVPLWYSSFFPHLLTFLVASFGMCRSRCARRLVLRRRPVPISLVVPSSTFPPASATYELPSVPRACHRLSLAQERNRGEASLPPAETFELVSQERRFSSSLPGLRNFTGSLAHSRAIAPLSALRSVEMRRTALCSRRSVERSGLVTTSEDASVRAGPQSAYQRGWSV